MIIKGHEVEYEGFRIGDIPLNPEPFRWINRIPIRDNREPLVDLRETNPELSFGVYCLPYVRESVATALQSASQRTPSHLELWVYTALRTLEQQAEMYWHNYRKAKEEHPHWPESVLRRMTNRFFAPPDAKAPPGHCTGGAVDVGLIVRETGEGLDVRSPHEGWNGAPTAVAGLSPDAAENRRLLCYIMHSTGLSNCRDEFWHWSYGDSAWAVRVGAAEACYGLIEPPEDTTRVTGPRLEVVPYDPGWPAQFEMIRTALFPQLESWISAIEHVGGTSVPGLASQPVLDIDLVVRDAEQMGSLVESLKELGYARQENRGTDGCESFQTEGEPSKAWPGHHLGAFVAGSLELRQRLAFRDYLRTHLEAAAVFTDLKMRLAARHRWDRIRYTRGKEPFVRDVLGRMEP